MSETLRLAICVFIGSGIGGVCRFLLSMCVNNRLAGLPGAVGVFPWATFAVNVLGCFLIGVIYGLSDNIDLSPAVKTMLAAGFCGGLTTFSTFSHENFLLFSGGNWIVLGLYVMASIIFGFIAARLGHAIVA